ncbi:glycerol-3-phosphate acyltransferase [candidate division WOR-3 bacterium]|nr:glycerol-3-phosphate acyltransferase [candidate division WOR-3 bacterium]
MNILVTAGAAVAGYLLGSISWSRVIARWVAPGRSIERIEYPVPGTNEIFTSDSVSATAARVHLGTRFGCLTAVLDILKVFLPALAFRLLFPGWPYHVVCAAAGLVGHDWPLFFRFKGGRGESPIVGGLLAIAPLGLAATSAASVVLGLVIGHLLVFRWAWFLLMIPWLWVTTGSPVHVGYMVFANVIYWWTMSPELLQYARMEGNPTQEEIGDFFAMGAGLGRFMDRYSILGLVARARRRRSERQQR